MNDTELTAALKAAKEQGYKEGFDAAYRQAWEDAFAYLFSLMGHKAAISLPDEEVKDKLTSMDAFLQNLKF